MGKHTEIMKQRGTYGKPLTASYCDILKQLCDGLVLKQIAHNRGVSLRTVECQLKTAKERLGAKTAVQAAIMFDRSVRAGDSLEEHY